MSNSARTDFARWASGTGSIGPQIAVSPTGTHVAAARHSGLVLPSAVIFAPTADADRTIEGDIRDGYGELMIDRESTVQLVPYSLAAYIPGGGARLLRITTTDDFDQFLSDADAAHATGRFDPRVCRPWSVLADQPALGGWNGRGGPDERVWIGEDGSVSVGPSGSVLGSVDDPLDVIVDAWHAAQVAGGGCAVTLAGVLDHTQRSAAIQDRPWLRHYLWAIGAISLLAARQIDVLRVTGFGDDSATLTASDGLLLLWSARAAYLSGAATTRLVRLEPELAVIVESILMDRASAVRRWGAGEVARVSTYFASAGLSLTRSAVTS